MNVLFSESILKRRLKFYFILNNYCFGNHPSNLTSYGELIVIISRINQVQVEYDHSSLSTDTYYLSFFACLYGSRTFLLDLEHGWEYNQQ